jgi:starch synthase
LITNNLTIHKDLFIKIFPLASFFFVSLRNILSKKYLRKMANKVLFITQEIIPYVAESEMAIAGRKIPQTIQEKGREIRTFMPKWGNVNERRNQLHEVIRLSGMNLIIDDTDHPLIIKVASIQAARMQVYFIDNDDYFQNRLMATNENGEEYTDNDERAIFYARGVLETVKKLRWCPEVIHCQGWVSALAPLYIKKAYMDEPSFRDSKVVLSLFENDLKSNLQEDIIEKMLLKDIEKSDIEDVIPASATYKDLYKLAIKYSDGVILHSENIDPELIAYARELGVPVLEYQPIETFTDAINQFYDEIWS